MKTICILNSTKFWGGGEKQSLETALEFKKLDYKVILAVNRTSPLWRKAVANKITTFPVVVKTLSFFNIVKLLNLAYFYKREGVDIVLFSTSTDLKLGSISAKLAGVKSIVYFRGLAVSIKPSIINRFIFGSLLTHIVATSEETKRTMLKYLGKYISKSKIKIIYLGIKTDNKDETKLPVIQEKGRGLIIGNAGRLTLQKQQKYFIEIAKQLKKVQKEFTIFIAGAGELEEELSTLIKENNLQKEIILLGFVKEMSQFMNALDIFVLTSEWEGFGYVLAEAMLKKVPVVCFNTSSNPEVVTDNKTGFLVSFPNIQLMVEKIKELIEDKEKRKTMGIAAQQSVYDRFTLEGCILKLATYITPKD